MLQTNLLNYKKDLEWTYKPFLAILGKGLVTADGHNHRRQRTLLSHTLRIEILDEIPQMALRAVQRLSLKINESINTKTVLEMAEEFRNLTLQVIAEAVLSLPYEESDLTFANMYLPIVEEGNKRVWSPERMYIPSFSWFKYSKDVARLNNYVRGLIVQRWDLRRREALEANPTSRRQDILDKTISSVPEGEWSEEWIAQIRDEMKTFILAGHETSASMLTWSLYELSKNSELRDMVREEAKNVFHRCESGKFDLSTCTLPSRTVLDKLEFSHCCLKESLRKYSVVPTVVRVADQTATLGRYYIPKHTTLMVNMQGVHHNPEFWPEPLSYRPSRFLEEIKPYTFLPFIEGPRMCLGQYLSLLESKIVLALLVMTYDFEVTNDDAGLKHAYMIPIIPKTGHFMRATPVYVKR